MGMTSVPPATLPSHSGPRHAAIWEAETAFKSSAEIFFRKRIPRLAVAAEDGAPTESSLSRRQRVAIEGFRRARVSAVLFIHAG